MTRRRDRSIGGRDLTEWVTPVGRLTSALHTRVAAAIGPRRALIGSLLFGGGVAVASSVLAIRTYDAVTGHDGVASLDQPALAAAKRLRGPVLDTVSAGIAYVFGPVGMPVLTLAAAVTLSRRRRELSPFILIAAAGIGALSMTVHDKTLVRRNRPPHVDAIPPYERTPSFPSGHTLNATAICGTLAYLLALRQPRSITRVATFGAAAGVAGAVGLSRMLLGAHWLTDVIFGWSAGIGWVAAIITSDRLFLTSVDRLRR